MNTALDLVVCALDGCSKISAPDEVVWNNLTDLGYCSIEHLAKGITFTCAYCGGLRDRARDWHDCPQSLAARKRLQVAVSGIRADMLRPGQRRLTSMEMKHREDRRHDMAVSLSINSLPVRLEYSNGNQ